MSIGFILDLDPTSGSTPPPVPTPEPGTGIPPFAADPTTQAAVTTRLKYLIPNGWFASALKNAVLTGISNAYTFIYALLEYLEPQTRISSATDGFLDLIAADFFGETLRRKSGQTDPSFRANILANLIRERGTRRAVISILTQLTGRAPIIIEPTRPLDTGVYGGPGLGYGVAGSYGSLLLPFQAFVIAFRPQSAGIPSVAGYGISTGAYSTPSQAEYADLSFVQDFLSDSDIFDAIASVIPEATIAWTRISS